MSPKEPDKRPQHENEDLDAEEIAEGPAELFEADYDREPVSEADAAVPPGWSASALWAQALEQLVDGRRR